MFKLQMKFQKYLFILFICATALTFIFSMGILTDLRKTMYYAVDPDLGTCEFEGAMLYREFQPFNTQIFNLTLISLVVSVLVFISGCHTRRKYYITNYLASLICATVTIVTCAQSFLIVLDFKNRFLNEVDFVKMKELSELSPEVFAYSESTFWFDIFLAFSLISIILSVVIIINLALKTYLMIAENRLVKTKKEVA